MAKPDIEALIKCERSTPFWSGYRPTYLIREDYLTTRAHNYYDKDFISVGESALGTITFFSPEAYQYCLWEGKKICIQEGSRIVGHAVVMKIFNEILKKKTYNLDVLG